MRHVLLLLSISFILFSCKDDKAEKDLSIVPLTTTIKDSNATATSSSVNNLPVQMPANPTAVMPQTSTSMPQNVVTSTTTAPGMNPPHGQPGHRCDVKDGAPLSTAPARVATQPIANNPQIVSAPQPVAKTAAPAATTVTQKGMNPAHGQPGHRCDISVGAPLNSAPTTAAKPATTNNATANITPMATPTQNSPVVPALQNTSITTPATTPATKPAAAFTGKVNPAHGQPGHDCKVAVGQPLP